MKRLFSSLLLMLLVSACNAGSGGVSVAKDFWTYMDQDDYHEAARLTMKPEPSLLKASFFMFKNYDIELGKAQSMNNSLIIPTELVSRKTGERKALITVVQEVNGRWLVDYKAVTKSFTRGVMSDIHSQLDDGVDWLDQELNQALDELDSLLTPIEEATNHDSL